jgi:hypothetical protein
MSYFEKIQLVEHINTSNNENKCNEILEILYNAIYHTYVSIFGMVMCVIGICIPIIFYIVFPILEIINRDNSNWLYIDGFTQIIGWLIVVIYYFFVEKNVTVFTNNDVVNFIVNNIFRLVSFSFLHFTFIWSMKGLSLIDKNNDNDNFNFFNTMLMSSFIKLWFFFPLFIFFCETKIFPK